MTYRDPDLLRALDDFRLERQRIALVLDDNLARALPFVVEQALNDTSLPAAARLLMWHLRRRLDTHEYRGQDLDSLVRDTRFGKSTVSEALTRLVADGYLDMRSAGRRSREFRLPASRRLTRTSEAA